MNTGSMFLVFLTGAVIVQAWAWRRLIERVHRGTLTKSGSTVRYTAWAFLPVLAFVTIFVAMIGLEEWLHVAIIDERAPLLAFPVLGLSALGTVAFAARCAFLRRARAEFGSPASICARGSEPGSETPDESP